MSYEEAAETAARYAQKIMDMQPVYDAAMAWLKARDRYDRNPYYSAEHGLEKAEEELEDACRRAKEGR